MRTIQCIFVIASLMIFQWVNAQTNCVPDDTTLCLDNNRFAVNIDWQDQAGNPFTLSDLDQTGSAQANKINDNTGVFWTFSDQNYEFLVKILDGCQINNQFWVFEAATTNVEYTLTVTDTLTGIQRTYFNPQGNNSPPLLDTAAFATCPSNKLSVMSSQASTHPVKPSSVTNTTNACVANANTLCFVNNRFSVTVAWTDFQENSGTGLASSITDQSGLFGFFNIDSPELLINVYDGTSTNGYYWFYFSAISNVEFSLTVTDTQTGVVRNYVNPLGTSPPATLDNLAFAAGLSGNWYNPEQSGHGLQLEFIKLNGVPTVLAAWYVFKEGEPIWVIGLGSYEDNRALLNMSITGNTGFPVENFSVDEVETTEWGTLELIFDSSSEAQMNWSSVLPGFTEGSMPIQRLTQVAINDNQSEGLRTCHSGSWYNPDQEGHGFMVQVYRVAAELRLLMTWYTYVEGKQYWIIGNGLIEGDHATMPVYAGSGTGFPTDFDPESVEFIEWGTMTFELIDDANAKVSWQTDVTGFSDGEIEVTKLSELIGYGCIP